MKSNFYKLILTALLALPVFGLIQAQEPIKTDTTTATLKTTTQVEPIGNTFYHWETPVLEPINIDSIRQQKQDYEAYLEQIDSLENVLKSNKKQIKQYQDQANSEAKLVKKERSNIKQKVNFYKEDEKLLKTEKKLRDKEMKMLRKERRDFVKASKGLVSNDVDYRNMKFDERENRIVDADANWATKMDNLRKNQVQIQSDQKKLEDREREVLTRQTELKTYDEAIQLKAQQIAIEKKQANLEIKRAKMQLK